MGSTHYRTSRYVVVSVTERFERMSDAWFVLFSYVYSEGGFFKAHLYFPKEYPLRPPKMKFVTEIWHPNSEYL